MVRVKTNEELTNEYGPRWKNKGHTHGMVFWNDSMDVFLGLQLHESLGDPLDTINFYEGYHGKEIRIKATPVEGKVVGRAEYIDGWVISKNHLTEEEPDLEF